ncbi:hypothetical protein P4O66_010816, partial [Electrophorus voltai]
TALSAFFQETNIPYGHHHQMGAFEALLALSLFQVFAMLPLPESHELRTGKGVAHLKPLTVKNAVDCGGFRAILFQAGRCAPRAKGSQLRWGDRGHGPQGASDVMCTPANTPATPPNFPDALTMFSRLKASEGFSSSSPSMASMATSPPPPPVSWGMTPSVAGQQGLWTQGPAATPAHPAPGWPSAVNQQAAAEQKASVAMEAER